MRDVNFISPGSPWRYGRELSDGQSMMRRDMMRPATAAAFDMASPWRRAFSTPMPMRDFCRCIAAPPELGEMALGGR